jgi:pimeloyl-ACP methyl ester carboxylesterase
MHGGADRRKAVASPRQLSVARMVPIARRIARAGAGRLAVYRLLNSGRGASGEPIPVEDAGRAIDQLVEFYGGGLPVCLVGHSLGGRAAVFAAAGRPEVRSVVALAPWFTASDDPGSLGDREVLFVHGTRDWVASPNRAVDVADRIRRTTPVRFVMVEGAGHAMVRRHAYFSGAASDWALRTLDGARRRAELLH